MADSIDSTFQLQDILAEVKDHARGMWRYKWPAAVAAWLISVAGWTYVYLLPDTYLATAKVYVDTESLMNPMFEGLAIRDNLGRQAEIVSRALLTRPNLEKVALDTDLHLRAESAEEMERLITNLQRNITVRADTRRNTFDISFEDRSRVKAREVVAEIVNAFVENSLEGQGEDAEMTARAVNAEIANHESRLREAESSLAQFKKTNLGYMPTDRGDYYARLQLGIDSGRELELEISALVNVREELQRQLQSQGPTIGSDESAAVNCSQQAQLAELKAQLSELELNFTDRHPRIQGLRETISGLEERCQNEWDAVVADGLLPRGADGESVELSPVFQNIQIQLNETEVDLARLRSQLQVQQREVIELRDNVDKIADVEKELKQLNRDYDVIQARYQELLERRETLQSKERLGPATDVVPFRTLEPPFAAAQPTGPKRGLMIAAVFVLAVGFSGVVAFLLNQLNPVFYSKRAVRKYGSRPVLGAVSVLESPQQRHKRVLLRFIWFGAYAGLLVATGLAIALQSPASAFLRRVVGVTGV